MISLQLAGIGLNKKKIENQPENQPKKSLKSGSDSEYKQALLLEKLRDALMEQANVLKAEVDKDIDLKSRQLAPRVFGWNSESIPGLSKYSPHSDDYESAWETLRGLESHQYRLEDPGISNEFFSEIQEMLLADDLRGVKHKYLEKYPWLTKHVKTKNLFSHPVTFVSLTFKILNRKKKEIKKKAGAGPPKKSIAQKRLEQDLADKEAEVRKIMSTTFQASTIPSSTLIPKYQQIISTQGTKGLKLRQKATLDMKARLEQKAKGEENVFTSFKRRLVNLSKEISLSLAMMSPNFLPTKLGRKTRKKKLPVKWRNAPLLRP
jgi:hypothetical protein